MVKFLINRPVSVCTIFFALLLLGFIAAKKVAISPLPNIDILEVTVHVNYNGASARELENTVVQRLRTQLLQVSGLDDIHSDTRDGYSNIRMRFEYGTDINFAFIETNEKVDLLMGMFPRDMERPRVIKTRATDIPVFHINLHLKESADANSSSRFIQLSEFAEQVIKQRLEQLPEIAFVDITGVSHPEIFITPKQIVMTALSLEEEDFKQVIENNNFAFSNVRARDGELQYNIRVASANPHSVEDIRNIRFKHRDRILKLQDVADIGIRQQDAKGAFFANGKEAVNMAIIKQPDIKMEELRNKINDLLIDFKLQYTDIAFEQAQDQTQLLDYSIKNLKQDLYLGSLLAFFLMFFFLKNFRAPILIGITIPVSLVISILFFYLIGISINIISLAGLVLGVGLMIDNSIIVIENITQYREQKFDLASSCERGTTEVIRPLISSVLTTCSVFLPLIFLSGIAGALFYEQAMAITIGLVVSLIVSVTLLPTLYRLLHLRKPEHRKITFLEKLSLYKFFESFYEISFYWVFRHKRASVALTFALILSNIFLFSHLKKEKIPALEHTELVATIDWNKNIHVAENKIRMAKVVKSIQKELIESSAFIGEQQYLLNNEKELSSSELQIYLKTHDSAMLSYLKQRITQFISQEYPEATLELSLPKSIFEKVFGGSEPNLVVRLNQVGSQQLPAFERVEEIIRQININIPKSNITPVAMQRTLDLQIDTEKLLLYNLSLDAIYSRLRSALNTNEIGNLRNGTHQIPIVVSDQMKYVDEVLKSTTVVNSKGVMVPVESLLSIMQNEDYKSIQGGKEGNFISLAVEGGKPDEVINFVNKMLIGDRNIDVTYTGSYFSNKKLIQELALVLLVAVLLLYFILAAQFESLLQPLIVLLELPISMSGALIMLFLFGASINLVSMIGLVVMSGIIINDSILKIDAINQLRRNKNYSLMEAIKTGGQRRLKSIIMTSMTTILSVLPFLFSNDMGSLLQRPLSLALIGGMLVGTPVSLYLIPLAYWFFYRKEDIKKRELSVAQ